MPLGIAPHGCATLVDRSMLLWCWRSGGARCLLRLDTEDQRDCCGFGGRHYHPRPQPPRCRFRGHAPASSVLRASDDSGRLSRCVAGVSGRPRRWTSRTASRRAPGSPPAASRGSPPGPPAASLARRRHGRAQSAPPPTRAWGCFGLILKIAIFVCE